MSNYPNKNNINNNKMYTSTPIRSKARNGMQYNTRFTDDEHPATGYNNNQNYYSLPMSTYNNSQNMSETNEYQSLPVDTCNSTMPELLNENELQLVIEQDTDDSCTNYKTADTTYKSNHCQRRPLYFDKSGNPSQTSNYIDIPLNRREYSKPSTSCSSNSSTICSKNQKFIIQNSTDMEYYKGRAREESIDSSGEEMDDFPPKLMLNVNKEPQYRNNPNWNPNSNQDEKFKRFKPHISMETYPSSTEPLKKPRRIPTNIPLIKEDDYQQMPPFLHSSESMDSSGISSCIDENTIDPKCLKYSSKEDLSAKSDSINMLSVVISTVMLLASKSQIPQNYVTWTLKYLKCIKNKQGQYPPNIRKIQKMLTLPTGTGQWQCMDFLAGKNPGKRLDLTKTRKK